MALEKRPANPIPAGYVPRDTKPYKVKDGDTWESVARRHGIDVRELIYVNFQTENCREVNWYLYQYVGCRTQTHNQYNWKFTSSARPGIIHIPLRRVIMPPVTIEGKVPSKWGEVWAGLAKTHSGDLFVVGAHDLTGKVYNLGDEWPNVKNAVINVNGYKFGLGLGADVNMAFVIVNGFANANEMIGVDGGWDFDLAIGAKLGDFLKGVKGLGKVIDTVEKLKKLVI
jgi:hypothetical protein